MTNIKINPIVLALVILGICIVGIAAASAADINNSTTDQPDNLGYVHIYVYHNGEPSNYPYIKATNSNGGTMELNQSCDGKYIIDGIIFHEYDSNWKMKKYITLVGGKTVKIDV